MKNVKPGQLYKPVKNLTIGVDNLGFVPRSSNSVFLVVSAYVWGTGYRYIQIKLIDCVTSNIITCYETWLDENFTLVCDT